MHENDVCVYVFVLLIFIVLSKNITNQFQLSRLKAKYWPIIGFVNLP